jgi:hypothetical protein
MLVFQNNDNMALAQYIRNGSPALKSIHKAVRKKTQ